MFARFILITTLVVGTHRGIRGLQAEFRSMGRRITRVYAPPNTTQGDPWRGLGCTCKGT